MGSHSSPSEFFNHLLFYNGINDILHSFYNNQDLQAQGYSYFGHDSYIKTDLFEDEHSSIFIDDEITKDGFFVREVEKMRLKWFQILIAEISEISPDLNVIKIYYKKATSIDNKYYSYISIQLRQLINDLRIYFPQLSHPVFNLLNIPQQGQSFFQYKELPGKFFSELFDIAIQLDLIDDVDTTEEMFYDVFTCDKPSEKLRLTFIKPNPVVAYFLKQIEVFFDNFNAITIEKSCCFYNKQGKPLYSSDIYTALSRGGNDKNKAYYKKIDSYIIPLKRYLKE